jgi:ATP phosphoribosyltransferase regulatory subunit
LLLLLQGKDVPSLRECCALLDAPVRTALLALPDLYGGARCSRRRPGHCLPCRKLPPLWRPCAHCRRRCPICRCRSISLTCAATTITTASSLPPIARDFRRPSRAAAVTTASARLWPRRPATGFSMDLRELARLAARATPAGRDSRPVFGDLVRAWRGRFAPCASRAKSSSNCCRAKWQRRTAVRPPAGRK